MSPIEIAAFLLGLANVTLVVRRSIWNYPFGLAMVALYAWIFLGAKLYSDAVLQLFFFAVQIYGWQQWARARADAGEVRVELLSRGARSLWLAGCAVAAAAWGMLMHRYTDAAFPWWDGTIAMLSVAAQILMSKRYLENWVLWIAVDALAIGLFAVKGLWLTALLYAIFLVLASWGLVHWARVRAAA
ncbi:MAG: nicotinamide riboside transporter PnuC [Pseudomonadota bacterium]